MAASQPVAFSDAKGVHTRRVFEGAEMTALTVRLPDEKHRRLKALAKSRGTPLNRLIDDMTTVMLAEFDAETRFQVRSARGNGGEWRGLGLLGEAMAVNG
jgi:HicB family